ncbi:MAG: hypothetical protein RIF46_10525 [Cyclobacteriaceae bacterium]
MKSKWIIDLPDFEGYRIGEDKHLYRLPYYTGRQYRNLRRIKIIDRGSKGYWIWKDGRNVWYSLNMIRPKLKLDPSPTELFPDRKDLPF